MAFRVRGIKHLKERVIPFFEAHPLKTKKRIDFMKFREVVLLMARGEHLTPEGIERIREIAARMKAQRER